jgi:protein Mpv17
MGVLEGRGLAGGIEKLRTNFVNTFLGGSVFWPVVNMINFVHVPSTHRLLYVNGCGLIWNAFLR